MCLEKLVIVYLHLIPEGGLANRLRAFASAAWLAEAVGARVVLDWRVSPAHGARFGDLFATPVDEALEKIAGLPKKEMPLHVRFVPLKLFEPGASDRVVSIRTCWEVDVADRPASWPLVTERLRARLAVLEPVAAVSRRVRDLAALLGGRSLGVHVRAGRDVSFFEKHNVAVDQFLDAVARLAVEVPTVKFYVASDTASVVARFIEAYGQRVVTARGPAAPVERRTTATVEDAREALVDFLVLSRTHRIVGTYFSSFSWLASVAGGVPLKVLAKA